MSQTTELQDAQTDAATRKTGLIGRLPSFLIQVFVLLTVLATAMTSAGLVVYGALETLHFFEITFGLGHAEKADHNKILFTAIEIVDLFLLATVIQVVSLGLFQLYFAQDLALPAWLKIRNLDDLKAKLVGVLVTMLGVSFLGQVLVWDAGPNIAYLGAGVAVVAVALTFFLKKLN